jgi:hypothetical protein
MPKIERGVCESMKQQQHGCVCRTSFAVENVNAVRTDPLVLNIVR